jgi:ATP-dependent DNA helicase PIF1
MSVYLHIYIYRTNELDELIERVYPADQLSNPDTYPALFGSFSILASQNITVDDINKLILNRMPGEQHALFSVDKADVSNSDDTNASNELFQVTTKYLYPPNFPRSKLQLKIGSVVMLLRNLNVQAGLCNETRMLVREVGAYTLQVSIITSANPDDTNIIHCIPRITLSTLKGELSFTLTRKQFPVRLCFAMTINKSQG